ncbi:MAG: GspH/FimT family pseudopilin [Verrucomicrobia bacterium]|nr:GspH/FimT family pseudopilin [Verrucomicrobiota bacterium]
MHLRSCHLRPGVPRPRQRAFTLIELLVAAAIAALMMMTAIPYAREVRKTPLVRGVNALVEGFRQARLKAILQDRPMQVVIYDSGGAIGVEPVPQAVPRWAREPGEAEESGGESSPQPKSIFDARIDDEVAFRRLDVNGRDMMAAAATAIRFFPNGTSDAVDLEMQWLREDARRITVDIMTGQPTVEAIR